MMRETCKLYGVDKARTTTYKPSTNGVVERFHRTLNSMLGKVVSICQRDWVERLPYVMASSWASRHEATGFSSNLLVFGWEVRTPIDLVLGTANDLPASSREDFVYPQERLYREAYLMVCAHLGEEALRRKQSHDMRVWPATFPVETVRGGILTTPQNGSGTIPGHLW